MTALSSREIKRRLFHADVRKRVVITPLGLPDDRISGSSIDLRLGTKFIVAKRAKYAEVDPLEIKKLGVVGMEAYQDRQYVKIGEKLIIHPGQLVLGITMEYVKLPFDLMGYVVGRSSWGKSGLIIATATLVQPLFAGVLTLELVNQGDTPIDLYPYSRIGQLVLHQITNANPSMRVPSRYLGSVGPEFSRIHEDRDWDVIQNLRIRQK